MYNYFLQKPNPPAYLVNAQTFKVLSLYFTYVYTFSVNFWTEMKAMETGAGLPDKLKQRQQHRSELIGNLWVDDILVDFIKRLLWGQYRDTKCWFWYNLYMLPVYRLFNNCIMLYGRWRPGISRIFHCDQLSPREYNASMAGNPCNPTMFPHAVFQVPATLSY